MHTLHKLTHTCTLATRQVVFDASDAILDDLLGEMVEELNQIMS